MKLRQGSVWKPTRRTMTGTSGCWTVKVTWFPSRTSCVSCQPSTCPTTSLSRPVPPYKTPSTLLNEYYRTPLYSGPVNLVSLLPSSKYSPISSPSLSTKSPYIFNIHPNIMNSSFSISITKNHLSLLNLIILFLLKSSIFYLKKLSNLIFISTNIINN